MRWWPRSIRWQMLAGLLLLESLSIGLFAVLLLRQQRQELRDIAQRRLAYEAESLALQAREALVEQQPGWIAVAVKMVGDSPTVALAKVTDPAGKILFVSKRGAGQTVLMSAELAQLPMIRRNHAGCLSLQDNLLECAQAIYTGNDLRGFAWVERDSSWAREQLRSMLRATAIFAVVWFVASAILVLLMARSIARPLAVLHRGAGALMSTLEDGGNFPLPVAVHNEIGDLIETFNRMVASLAEQRAGLNDTLSLLDSMLANAPIGLAFFDRSCRFVRVNQVFADLTGLPLSRHLGRTLPELLPQPVERDLESAVLRVFSSEEPIRNLELSGENGPPGSPGKRSGAWTWLASCYPVRTTSQKVRWVGLIVLDASDRKRNEEALRRSEKLAVTGRLAASIAHEINNPLEAITNLLFLLRNHTDLDKQAMHYATMAEHEVRRISEITQQTLRFYRQSTLPARTTMADLLDSVLSLYQGRVSTLNLRVERDYEPEMDLFCFAGEIRQVFANLIGNSIDAAVDGTRLVVRARRSRNWKNPSEWGVRFAVADTGLGMEPHVRERIFEAFFTTKEATGTGLGLWVSREIVMKHRGIIHVRSRAHSDLSERSGGTVFQIFLPDDPEIASRGSSEQPAAAIPAVGVQSV
ncbi:MAG TPA: ATP-binding protein [Terracidiphilus sp.]|nr:ATP-binding protein [Terracidiphilus sp.]